MCKIEFSEVTTGDAEAAYARLEESFCREELRDFNDFQRVLALPEYSPLYITADGEKVGYLGVWKLDGFLFIEHLAVFPEVRGKGLGHRAILKLEESYGKIVLEIEPPVERNQIRRYGFYKSLGFKLNAFDYLQPPYRGSDKPLPLKLLSFPELLTDGSGTVKEIYKRVYGIEGDIL